MHEDPIYAYFTASERLVLEYRELQRQNRTVVPQGQHNVAFLGLATETGFPHSGKVDYVAATGLIASSPWRGDKLCAPGSAVQLKMWPVEPAQPARVS